MYLNIFLWRLSVRLNVSTSSTIINKQYVKFVYDITFLIYQKQNTIQWLMTTETQLYILFSKKPVSFGLIKLGRIMWLRSLERVKRLTRLAGTFASVSDSKREECGLVKLCSFVICHWLIAIVPNIEFMSTSWSETSLEALRDFFQWG